MPHPNLTRRHALTGLCGAVLLSGCGAGDDGEPLDETVPEAALTDPVVDIEDATGGRVGVAALNLATGERFAHNSSDRHAMASTFKWILAGLVLQRVDAGEESLDRLIRYTEDDLVPYAPVTEARIDTGLTVGELCAATVSLSDNPAANLLLRTIGGPDGFTQALRAIGDTVTRLDRWEPELNENAEGDVRDTTTADAMLDLMRDLLFGDVLAEPSRAMLQGWMTEASTGLDRLRAGLPRDWVSGDKTGTSANDQSNDVAFAIDPTGRTGPLLIVSFLNVPGPMTDEINFAHAAIARELAIRLV